MRGNCDEVRLLFDQLGLPNAVAAPARRGWGKSLPDLTRSRPPSTPMSRSCATRPAAVALIHAVIGADARYAIEPRVVWHSGHDLDPRDRGSATADGTAAYLDAEVLGGPDVRDAARNLLGADGPPLSRIAARSSSTGLRIDYARSATTPR